MKDFGAIDFFTSPEFIPDPTPYFEYVREQGPVVKEGHHDVMIVTGNRKVEMVPLKQVRPLTGYVRGGVTALACRKDYPVYVDEHVESVDQMAVSAGVRGTQIVLAPDDYLHATRATVASFARRKEQ